eukprot:CAMPEP_0180536824 /NCGR_PEP_ID=MMETSP1036_2-20121128/65487_1 /TAXON_ID=632150 /ORGANISM="Azadinium spinosum, Strain 3D9" /LENGTH=41 /DNA_ID= /DNA_START= /DNA_END= /DNA_ORIENTATION=
MPDLWGLGWMREGQGPPGFLSMMSSKNAAPIGFEATACASG